MKTCSSKKQQSLSGAARCFYINIKSEIDFLIALLMFIERIIENIKIKSQNE